MAGLILWKELPETITTHFGADNTPNGWSSKAFAVLGLPLIILAFHWMCILITSADPKKKNIPHKAMNIVLWICPATSLLVNTIIYAYTLNNEIKIGFITILFMGILFIALGNYLPKCKQNYSFGIKISWTLNDEENWNKTHRLAGKLWVMGGALICATAVFENPIVFAVILTVMTVVPCAYSYKLHKNK